MAASRHFSMSAFSALIAIRRYVSIHPGVLPEAAAQSIRKSDADLAATDFDTGLLLHSQISSAISFDDPAVGIRSALCQLIDELKPWWVKGIPYGRERLLKLLEPNEAQCFRAAGLLVDPPPLGIVAWWDLVAQRVRADLNDQLLAQGREAEILSLDHERKRLASLGIRRQPQWTSIEDNGAGYDIRSFDVGPGEPVNRLIEVKSSKQYPPRIVLTRGEWEAAKGFGSTYQFHIWKLPEQVLIERTVAEIGDNIPIDHGLGQWMDVEIEIR